MVCCARTGRVMRKTPNTLLSRLLAVCAMLCMAATLNAGHVAAQNGLFNLQHQISGDLKAADGGWAACADADHGCDGHLSSADAHGDGVGLHHHHHVTELPSGPLPSVSRVPAASLASIMTLRPGVAHSLAGRSPATLDQPPRV